MLGGSLPSWKTFLLLLWKLRGGNCVVRGQWLLGRHSLVWFCVRPCFWALPKHHFSRMDFQNSGLSNSSFWVILQSIAFEVAVCYPLYFVLWSLLRVVCFETENLWVALPALELILLDSSSQTLAWAFLCLWGLELKVWATSSQQVVCFVLFWRQGFFI